MMEFKSYEKYDWGNLYSGEEMKTKKFYSKKSYTVHADTNIEIVSVREESHGSEGKKKICFVSQPGNELHHTYLIAYILDNKFFVVPEGLKERGLELQIPKMTELCEEGKKWKRLYKELVKDIKSLSPWKDSVPSDDLTPFPSGDLTPLV